MSNNLDGLGSINLGDPSNGDPSYYDTSNPDSPFYIIPITPSPIPATPASNVATDNSSDIAAVDDASEDPKKLKHRRGHMMKKAEFDSAQNTLQQSLQDSVNTINIGNDLTNDGDGLTKK